MPCVLVVLFALLAFAGATASTSLAAEARARHRLRRRIRARRDRPERIRRTRQLLRVVDGLVPGQALRRHRPRRAVRRKRDDAVLRAARAEVHDQPVPERALSGEPVRPEAARRDLAVHARDAACGSASTAPPTLRNPPNRTCASPPTSPIARWSPSRHATAAKRCTRRPSAPTSTCRRCCTATRRGSCAAIDGVHWEALKLPEVTVHYPNGKVHPMGYRAMVVWSTTCS